MKYQEIEGNLITLAMAGEFDVIAHGCNCFCTMGAGIAPQMAKHFHADLFPLEADIYAGDMNKLGQIEHRIVVKPRNSASYHIGKPSSINFYNSMNAHYFTVVNAYTQYGFGRNHKEGTDIPLDYEALALCLKKMNHAFKGKHIGLPQIGCGLAGGDWDFVKKLIRTHITDADVTVVIYNEKV